MFQSIRVNFTTSPISKRLPPLLSWDEGILSCSGMSFDYWPLWQRNASCLVLEFSLEMCLERTSFGDSSLALAEGPLGFSVSGSPESCCTLDPHKGHLNFIY